jgi:uncharacterized protein
MNKRRLFALLPPLIALAFPLNAAVPPGPAAPTSDPTPIVVGSAYRFHSAVLNDNLTINVLLPAGYSVSDQKFPVLYLLDGGAEEDFVHIAGLAQISPAYGLTEPFILVGIAGRDRKHDLTPPSTIPADLRAIANPGGSLIYRQFLNDELRPWVNGQFRTNGKTVLMGESLAGQFVVETFLKAPSSFDDYVAVSPSLWWNGGSLAKSSSSDLAKHNYSGRRIWLASANEAAEMPEMGRAIDQLVSALKSCRADCPAWVYRPFPAETHASIYHPAAMQAIRYIFAPPPKN